MLCLMLSMESTEDAGATEVLDEDALGIVYFFEFHAGVKRHSPPPPLSLSPHRPLSFGSSAVLDFKGKSSQTKNSWSFLSGPVELIFTEHLLNAKHCEHREE